MKKPLKWFAITLAALLVIVGGATLALRLMVDEERLRSALLELVNANIDGELRIDGPLRISVWPTLSLAANDIHLSTPRGATQEFASARELRLGVALRPLLNEELRVHELRVAGLRLAADCDAAGRCNWAALSGSAADRQAPDVARAAGGTAAAPLALGIERIRIDGTRLSYDDARDGTHIEITDFELIGDGINSHGKPFELRTTAHIRSGTPPQEFGLKIRSTIDIDGKTSQLGLSQASIHLTPGIGPALELKLPQAQIDLAASTLQAARLDLSGSGISATASLDAGWAQPQGPRAQGRLELQSLDLPRLLGAFGSSLPATVNAAALTQITLAGNYAYTTQAIALERLELSADTFRASGQLRLGLGETPAVDIRIDSPDLDVDHFLLPAETPTSKDGKQASSAGEPSQALGALLTVDGKVEADIGHLKRGQLELEKLAMRLVLTPGKARLEHLRANLYGGSLNASGTLSAVANSARMHTDARLDGVDLARLLAAMSDTRRLSGRIDGSLQLEANGADEDALLASLTGPVTVTITDPAIEDFSVEETICKAAATINRESLSARFEPTTRLQSIRTVLDFDNGVGRFRELGLVLPNMHMNGKGNIDLPRQRLDVRLDVRVTNDLAEHDPACRMSGKMLAIDWPLRCTGSFDEEPKKWCGIDKDGLARIVTELATEKVKDKVEDKLRDKLKGKLGDLLKRG